MSEISECWTVGKQRRK